MNQKELGEIRRRIRPEHNAIHHFYGCYVNTNKEIVSSFDESLGLLTQEETEKYFSLLKKTLSGALGKNLLDISFATKQVMDSEEHRLLTALRKSELSDAALREEFYRCIIDHIDMEDQNYLILMAYDVYDVPHYGKDGQEDDRGDVYKYMLCCVCPVKPGKPELGYVADEKRFRSSIIGQVVAAPELGFLFPAFDGRATNIYNALFYSKNINASHQDFVDAVFRTPVPMSAGRQKESFNEALTQALDKDCSFDVVQAMHEQLNERIAVYKETKDPEPIVQGDQGSRAHDCVSGRDGGDPRKQRRKPRGGRGLLRRLHRDDGGGRGAASGKPHQHQPDGDCHTRGEDQREPEVQLSGGSPGHRREEIYPRLRGRRR